MKIKLGAICPHCKKQRLADIEVTSEKETETTRTCSRCRSRWIVKAREINATEKAITHILEWTAV